MKKIISLIISCIMAVSLLPVPQARAAAEMYAGEDFAGSMGAVSFFKNGSNTLSDSEACYIFNEDSINYSYKNDGALAMKAAGSGAEIFAKINFSKPYNGGGLVVEYKVKFDNIYGTCPTLFQALNGNTAAGNSIEVDKTGSAAYIRGSKNGVRENIAKWDWGTDWVHFMVVSKDGQNGDVFVNGNKIDTVELNIGSVADSVRLKQKVWTTGRDMYIDEVRVQSVSGLGIEETTLTNGVAPGNVIHTDFNMLLDESTVDSVCVFDGDEDITDSCTVSLDSPDESRITISVPDNDYTDLWVDYSGLKCIYGTEVSVEEDEEEEIVVDGVYEVFSTKSSSAISSTTKLSENTGICRLYEQSAWWNAGEDANAQIFFDEVDVSNAQYMYMWAYSEVANDSEFLAVVYTNNGSNSYFRQKVTVDWTGWKLIELPMSGFAKANNPDWSEAARIVMCSNGWDVTKVPGTEIAFEKIWFSDEVIRSFKADSASPDSGNTNMPCIYGDFVLHMSNPVSKILPDAFVLVSADDESEYAVNAVAEGNDICITYDEELDEGTVYSLKAKGIYDIFGQEFSDDSAYSFKTSGGILSAKDIVLTKNGKALSVMPKSGTISFETDVYNSKSEVRMLEAVIALYDENGRVAESFSEKYSVSPGESISVSVAAQRDSYSGLRAEAYIADITNAPFICANRLALLMQADYEEPEKIITDKFTAEISGDEISVSGKCDDESVPVLICASNGDADVFKAPVMADENGYFSYVIRLNPESDPGGEYKIRAASGESEEYEAWVYYVIEEQRKAILDEINSCKSKAELEELIEEYCAPLGIGKQDADSLENIAGVCFGQLPFNEFSDVAEMAETAIFVLDEINKSDWSQLPDIIEKHKSIISPDSSDYSYFKELSSAKAKKICMAVVVKGPFASIAEFAKEFSGAVDESKKEKPSSGSFGGGSGKSSGGASYEITVPEPLVSGAPAHNQNADVFTDLEGVLWAKNSIILLHSRGIVSTPENGLFRPEDNITREEFVKLLVLATGMYDEKCNCSFSDVEAFAWYYPYIACAYENSIVTGRGDGSFGTGDYVTREDMAVFIYRALQGSVGKSDPQASELFSDNESISGYAYDAVYAMKNAGIISGVGNNKFAPKLNATRAEAAKMIGSIIERMEVN